jgi:methylated-DNA-[protein]-cysteine S-methyltransferase
MSAQGLALFDTPIGACAVAWSAGGIVGMNLPEASPPATLARMKRRWPSAAEAEPPPAVQQVLERVRALLRGEPVDLADVPLDLAEVPEFNRKVYDVARAVPPGRTITYGEIAKKIGVGPEMARDVGQALGRNPIPIIVPCHRVLAASGKMGGFSANGGIATKRRMLEIEGAAALSAGPLFER